MFLLLFLAAGLILGLARGGKLAAFSHVRLRCSWLVLMALFLQVLAFSPVGSRWAPGMIAGIHIISYVLLALFLLFNLHLPGMLYLTVGLACNMAVIVANGGQMPAPADNLARIGVASPEALNNSTFATANTPLWWLGDVFYFPLPFLSNVFSIGDMLIGIGAAYFCYRVVSPSR